MKYIDAEKLYKQVDSLMARYAEYEKEFEVDDEELSIFYQGKSKMCGELLCLIDTFPQEQPSPYFYCIYGGTMPLCSDCKRNHNNSSFKTEEITTWYAPSNGTKHCIDYIQQEQVDINALKREWYNKGYLEGRKNAHIPARELGLPKSCDFQQEQTEVNLDEEVHRFFEECIEVHEVPLYGKIKERVIPVDCYELTARHFAEWGKKQKEQIPYIDFVIKPHKGDDNNPYDMSVSEAQDYATNRGFGIPFNDGEVYADERHMTQTIGNIIRWADEHPKEQKPVEWGEEDEAFLKVAIAICNRYSHKDIADWLKSLRPYPKQDWRKDKHNGSNYKDK